MLLVDSLQLFGMLFLYVTYRLLYGVEVRQSVN
jgi:hypothetical protein